MRKDITGQKFNYLTAIKRTRKYYNDSRQAWGEWMWECKCICGKFIEKRIGQLTTGDSKSCGCMKSEMLSLGRLNEKNSQWKGDKVGYTAIHNYIKRRLPKTKMCQCCWKIPPYDLANISNQYKRDLKDWEWLCRKCHMIKDGRMENLIKRMKRK